MTYWQSFMTISPEWGLRLNLEKQRIRRFHAPFASLEMAQRKNHSK